MESPRAAFQIPRGRAEGDADGRIAGAPGGPARAADAGETHSPYPRRQRRHRRVSQREQLPGEEQENTTTGPASDSSDGCLLITSCPD
jgi:hypothetical protein